MVYEIVFVAWAQTPSSDFSGQTAPVFFLLSFLNGRKCPNFAVFYLGEKRFTKAYGRMSMLFRRLRLEVGRQKANSTCPLWGASAVDFLGWWPSVPDFSLPVPALTKVWARGSRENLSAARSIWFCSLALRLMTGFTRAICLWNY